MTNEKIIPFSVDDALTEVDKMLKLVNGLLELGDKVKSNQPQLESVSQMLRQQEINSQFYLITECAEALHCQPKRAIELLRQRGVEIINAGKSYVVFKDDFINAFGGAK